MVSAGMAEHPRSGVPGLLIAELRPIFSRKMLLVAWAPCLAITVLHYRIGTEYVWAHDVLRRLYYLPILFATFAAGIRGGVAASVFASLIYFPHAFLSLVARDPGDVLEKGLEILLYNIVAVVAGQLVDRERAEREKQRRLAAKLSDALEEQRRIEAQLIRAGRLGALGELTAGIAHEIKNPLHTMKGTAEILRDVVPPEAPERKMLDLHLEEIDRLAQSAERFLTFARPSPPDRRPLNLAEIVGRVVSLLETQARKEGVRTVVRPYEGAETPGVSGDPEQLTQLLLNIAINGVQSMAGGGGGELAFSIGQERQGERRDFAVRISNTGPPIPEDQLERIFDPFFTTKDAGTGLGLSICARIADQHEGYLSVRNLPNGAGVEFALHLPGERNRDGPR
jgi:signal transduction histidine kinase